MALIEMHRIRALIGGIVAIVALVLLAAFGTAAVGIRLPILSNITDAAGFTAE